MVCVSEFDFVKTCFGEHTFEIDPKHRSNVRGVIRWPEGDEIATCRERKKRSPTFVVGGGVDKVTARSQKAKPFSSHCAGVFEVLDHLASKDYVKLILELGERFIQIGVMPDNSILK